MSDTLSRSKATSPGGGSIADAFVACFAARHDASAAAALTASLPMPGFAAVDPRGPAPAAPSHYSPTDPDARATAGWDPLDPAAPLDPRIDPLAAAHAAGYAEGLAAAAAADATRDRGLLDRLDATLGASVDREGVARRLRETVVALVGRMLGETGVAADRLAARVEAAVELLADQAESALLRVHPDDVPLLDGRLPATVFAAGDAAVQRGGFVLETASSVVEDGPDLWLQQLAEAIDRVPIPPC